MTSRILAALLILTVGLLGGALLPLGFTIAHQDERDFRNDTLAIAHTLAAAVEERLADKEKSTVYPHTLASLRAEAEGGRYLAVALADDHGHVVPGGATGLYTAARAAVGLSGHTQVAEEGDRLLAIVPVSGHTEAGAGAVMLSRPLAPLNDRITRLWAGLGLVAIFAVAAAVILALALARWVGRPMRRLELATESLGSGELGARAVPPKHPREVRRLAGRFNVMAGRLETLIYDSRTVLADVSHQLRTPLSALRLRLELLAEDATTADTAAEFECALGEVNRLSRLVDGLLTVARAEGASAPPEPVHVTDLLHERADAWRPIATESDVDLSVSATGEMTALLGPGHLQQVMDNLIDNALTATPDGGHVRLVASSADHQIRITVADNGPGMSDEVMREAFRRFRSGHAGGTGLGLAIVHRLVTADGGTVTPERNPDGGLTIVLDYPRS